MQQLACLLVRDKQVNSGKFMFPVRFLFGRTSAWEMKDFRNCGVFLLVGFELGVTDKPVFQHAT